MSLPVRNIKFNGPQAFFCLATQKYQSLEMGRGGGKSTVLAKRIQDMCKAMPRAKIGLVASTYQQAYTRTLPSTIEGLELLGIKKDLHYFVGKRPPKHWKWQEAYQPPLSYDNFITFYNGFGMQIISLENEDGRGLNLDGIIGDEAAKFDKEKLENNVQLSNRGNIHRFSHTWLHHSELYASTTPVSVMGRWFIHLEEMARKEPHLFFHLIAPSTYNIDNLGAEYFRDLKRKLTPLIFDAEVMCIRPGRAQTGFYPAFSEEIHTYECSNDKYVFNHLHNLDQLKGQIPDADVNVMMPLDMALDYGANINTMVVGQSKSDTDYRIVNALFVKTPETVMDLTRNFCKYYSWHIKKEVNYYYDHTAQYKDAARTTTFADEVTKVLEANGWTVNRIYVGQAPLHATKYLFFNLLYRGQTPGLPFISINSINCKYLILSILKAGAREGVKGTEKDKRPERQDGAIDEETTHFSDAKDTLLYSKFKDGVVSHGWFM